MPTESQTPSIPSIARQFGLRLMVQFGSSLDPQRIEHPESDTDLAVLAAKPLTLEQKGDLQYQFARHFGVFEDRIDLVDLSRAGSLLRHQVATKGRVLFDADDHQFNEFYVHAIRQYIDEQDLFDFERDYLVRKLQASTP